MPVRITTDHPARPGVLMVFAVGVGDSADAYRSNVAAIDCGDCGRDALTFADDAEFHDAIGCGLCVPCFTDAGWENAHSDGNHGPGTQPQCPACRELDAQ